MNKWKNDLKYDPLDVVGKEKVTARNFSKRLGYYVTTKTNVVLEPVSFYLALANECYHGGKRAWNRALRPKTCKLARCEELRQLVAAKLYENWSPEQIAGWLKHAYPDDEDHQVSH